MALHVMHVIDTLRVGGAERMLVELANRTVADGHRVSVCVTRSGTDLAARLDPRCRLHVLDRKRRVELAASLRLARIARDVDVVHCHGPSSFSFLALLSALRLVDRPLVLHDHHNAAGHPRAPRWLRYARKYVAAYVSVYEAQAAWAQQSGLDADRIHTIPNAVDMDGLAGQNITGPALTTPDGKTPLIFVGGLRREKAVDVLLDAIARVRAPVMLHIVGGDADRDYAQACRDRAATLGDRVRFEGERTDALALARTAALAVHSSRAESGPLVLAEYAALAVPFVSTSVGGVAELLQRAGVGWFVPPEDPAALAAAIDAALLLPIDERKRRAATWRQTAHDLLDISVVMPTWYRLYAAIRAAR